jgi:TolB protein
MRFFLFISVLFFSACSENEASFVIDDIKQLTYDGDNGEAYFNYDASKVIFQSKRGDNECDKLFSVNLDGTQLAAFTEQDGAYTCAYYSLDDTYLFYASTLHLGEKCPEIYKDPNPRKYIWPLRPFEIFRTSENETIALTDTPNGYNAEATIHPLEEKIIFTSLRDGDINLYEMNYDGSDLKQITSEYGYDGGAFYSPDGTQIVWRAWYPSTEEERIQWAENLEKRYIESVPLNIYIADRDGSNKKQITNNQATNWAPSWLPDGKHIIFSSNMDDWREDYQAYGSNFELYVINIESLKIQRITFNQTFDSFPVVAIDNVDSKRLKIVFASNRNAKNPRQTNIFTGYLYTN